MQYKTSGLSGSHAVKPNRQKPKHLLSGVDGGKLCVNVHWPVDRPSRHSPHMRWYQRARPGHVYCPLMHPHNSTSPAQNLNTLKVQMGEELMVVFSLPGLKSSLDSLQSFPFFWGTKFWHKTSGV